MRRGRSIVTGNSWTTRPGRLESSTTRSPSRTASRTLWVTKTTVRSVSRHRALELVVQHVSGHRVERAERLVHQEDVDLLRERTRERDALAHAARELVRSLGREASEVHELEQLVRRRCAARPCGTFCELERRARRCPRGEPGEQRRLPGTSSVVRRVADVDRAGASVRRARRRCSAACSCRSRTRRAGRRTRRSRRRGSRCRARARRRRRGRTPSRRCRGRWRDAQRRPRWGDTEVGACVDAEVSAVMSSAAAIARLARCLQSLVEECQIVQTLEAVGRPGTRPTSRPRCPSATTTQSGRW